MYNRRDFLRAGSAALVGSGFLGKVSAKSGPSRVPASERLRFGLVGCNGMGVANMNALLGVDGVDCHALCDVDRNVLEERAGELEEATGSVPDIYEDYRAMLDDPDIDIVIIATPDHWHCLQMIHACEAGKDVFVEKPLGNSIGECMAMEAAVERTGRVVQCNQWQRSDSHWYDAVDFVQAGEIGRVRLTKSWAYQGWMGGIDPEPDQEAPPGVNYDMWLGPAPERPFNPNRFHFNFRWFWDYAGGLMTDWGVHLIDFVFHGMDVGAANSAMSLGGKFGYPDDASETPDTQQAVYEFDDFSMIWEHATGIDGGPYERDHGIAFIGNYGTVVVDRGGWVVYPEEEDGEYLVNPFPQRTGEGGLGQHAQNFVDAIREGTELTCPADVAANTAINAHLGNVAFRLGRRVDWDANEQQFVDDPEANEMIWPTYRDPYQLPRG